MAFRFARFLIRFFTRLIAHIQIEGMENVPEKGAYVVASNHLGRLDVPLIYVVLNRTDITMLVAEKYQKYAIIRWFVKQLNATFVDRYKADLNAMRVALARLKAGGIICIAPEGTRSRTGGLIEGKPGTVYLASRSGAPILPIAVWGQERAMQCWARLHRADIHVRIAKPIILPPGTERARASELAVYTDQLMLTIARMMPPAYRGVYAERVSEEA